MNRYLCCWLLPGRQFRKDRSLEPWQAQLRCTDNADFQYACHMGFFNRLDSQEKRGEASGSSTYIPLTKISIRELQQQEFEAGEYAYQGNKSKRSKTSEILS